MTQPQRSIRKSTSLLKNVFSPRSTVLGQRVKSEGEKIWNVALEEEPQTFMPVGGLSCPISVPVP